MKKKDLKNIILEAYTEVLIEQEDKESFDLDDELEDKKIIPWKDIPDNIKASLKKNVDYRGRPAPGDPTRDYVDKEYDTYYYTTAYNKETNSYKHAIIRLPSFENLYNRYAKILKDINCASIFNQTDFSTKKAFNFIEQILNEDAEKQRIRRKFDKIEILNSNKLMLDNIENEKRAFFIIISIS